MPEIRYRVLYMKGVAFIHVEVILAAILTTQEMDKYSTDLNILEKFDRPHFASVQQLDIVESHYSLN